MAAAAEVVKVKALNAPTTRAVIVMAVTRAAAGAGAGAAVYAAGVTSIATVRVTAAAATVSADQHPPATKRRVMIMAASRDETPTIAMLAPGTSGAARQVVFPVIRRAIPKVQERSVETIINTVLAVPMGEEVKMQAGSGVALVLAGTTRANGLGPNVGGATLRKTTVGVGAPAVTTTPAAAPRMDVATAWVAGRGMAGVGAVSVGWGLVAIGRTRQGGAETMRPAAGVPKAPLAE